MSLSDVAAHSTVLSRVPPSLVVATANRWQHVSESAVVGASTAFMVMPTREHSAASADSNSWRRSHWLSVRDSPAETETSYNIYALPLLGTQEASVPYLIFIQIC